MIWNYFKIGLRNISRNRTYAIINTLGLTIGLAISTIIAIYVVNELTYDSFHDDADNIYRLYKMMEEGRAQMSGTGVDAPLGPYLVEHYPKVTQQARMSRNEKQKFTVGEKVFEENMVYADSGIYQIFTLNFIYGEPKTALIEPFSLVLTEKIAKKFFGDINPVGKVIEANNQFYKITAAVKNLPENTHLNFDILCSFSTQYKLMDSENKIDGWGSEYNKYTTYIKLANDYSKEELSAEFPKIVEKYLSDNPDLKHTLSLQPVKKIYLYYDGGGSISRVTLFSVIGIFVLLIACINYMNLNTAVSIKRLKEIGVRKVVGASRKQLINQFLFESVLLSFFSLVLALLLAEILLPLFNSILEKNLSFNIFANWPIAISLILLAFATGIIAGLYPAFYLSTLYPVNAIKGKSSFGLSHSIFRNTLVVTQFSISIFLLCCTGIIFMQINHVNNTDLGFQKNNIITLNLDLKSSNNDAEEVSELFENTTTIIKNELSMLPEISKISIASGFPYGHMSYGFYQFDELKDAKLLVLYLVDSNYIDLLELKILEGQTFAESNNLKENGVIINETFAKEMNWEFPIGKTFKSTEENQQYTVIGVVKDFHTRSFHQRILPTFLIHSGKFDFFQTIGLKVQPGKTQEVINKVEKISKDYDLSNEIRTSFLEQKVQDEYLDEYRTGKMFTFFAILAFVIAAMGLYGLSLFVSKYKTKEIGIRKVFGCSIIDILLLLSKKFAFLILISAAIAIPMAWLYMDKWLESFVYQVEDRWVIYVIATITTIIAALATIFHQSFKTSYTNPVDIIKYE